MRDLDGKDLCGSQMEVYQTQLKRLKKYKKKHFSN
jgi:hypothetical protein